MRESDMKPLCLDCLSEDVSVCVTDSYGFKHYFCAEDWASWQAFHEKIVSMLSM